MKATRRVKVTARHQMEVASCADAFVFLDNWRGISALLGALTAVALVGGAALYVSIKRRRNEASAICTSFRGELLSFDDCMRQRRGIAEHMTAHIESGGGAYSKVPVFDYRPFTQVYESNIWQLAKVGSDMAVDLVRLYCETIHAFQRVDAWQDSLFEATKLGTPLDSYTTETYRQEIAELHLELNDKLDTSNRVFQRLNMIADGKNPY